MKKQMMIKKVSKREKGNSKLETGNSNLSIMEIILTMIIVNGKVQASISN